MINPQVADKNRLNLKKQLKPVDHTKITNTKKAAGKLNRRAMGINKSAKNRQLKIKTLYLIRKSFFRFSISTLPNDVISLACPDP